MSDDQGVRLLENHIRLANGFMYEPLRGNFYWTPTKLTHYAMQAIKAPPSGAKGMMNYEQRRHAPAKGKRQQQQQTGGGDSRRPKRPLDEEEMMQVIEFDQYKLEATNVINEFKTHLETRLVTRTSTQAFETLKIQIAGLDSELELRDIAQLSMKANLIVINLNTMPEAVKPAAEAIESLGNVRPQVEANTIYVPVPRITREHREKLVAGAGQLAKQAKGRLRDLFSCYSKEAKSLDKPGSGVSRDLVHDVVENLHFDVGRRIEQLDELLKKRSELLLNQKS